ITATASVMPDACGDHTYSVNVEVEFANGQGRDLIVEDWKGNKRVFPTTPADTKIDDPPVFEYQKYTPGGQHGFKVYFDGYEDCAVYAYYIEPAQPKIDIVHTDIGSVTSCGATYDLSVKFEYTNQDGTLSVDLDGRPADKITPDFVKDEFDKQTATATFIGLTADGQKHTLTVQTTGGVHNCQKSVTVDAPQAEDIITSVEVTDVPENIRCDQTEYDVTITVTMSSDNAIGKKIIIAHEGQTDDFIATANPMETTVKMTTADATGLTVDAYFDGHPECKVTSKTFDAPKRLKCIKDYAQTCEGERYTWSVTGLTYGPFAKAGMDTIVNEFNVLDTLIVTVYPTYNMPEEQVTIIDGETYTWNGKDYETEGIYKETLLSEHDCDSIVTLNLTVKENIVEEVAFTIAEQCAGEGLLEIAVQHTGLLTDARLTFSPEAVAAGFVNDTYPLDDQDIVSVPYNVKAGIFSVHIDLLFHSRLKHSADEPFTLLFPRTVLEQGWMDAIFVLTHDYNGGYDFTDFQWYKKGQMLVGETGPYLYQPLEVGAEYSAMLTEVSGLKLMTCPLIVTEHSEISLYPTVVTRKDLIHVNVSQDARLTLYSIMGERHNSYSLLSGDTQINAPGTQGIYLAEIVLESGQRKVFKIMVR
ncbi:MAG: T9SS type A sorting domain-containing protein, partial [Paludibacteraceae bacterium]|nr:T9SS type A sorting domain-containing protein [Paludibacteraceae bacterium]